MAYIFHEDDLPKLVSAVPGRERTFFVNKELTHIDDMLAGIMRYKQGASSPCICMKTASTSTSSWKARAAWKRPRASAM